MDSREVEMEETEEEVPHDAAVEGREDFEEDHVDAKVEGEQGDSPRVMVEDEQNFMETGTEEMKDVGDGSDQESSEEDSDDSGSPNQNGLEEEKIDEHAEEESSPSENGQRLSELPADETHEVEKDDLLDGPNEPFHKSVATAESEDHGDGTFASNKTLKISNEADDGTMKQHEPATPGSLVKHSSAKAKNRSVETPKLWLEDLKMADEDECGTPEDQAAFMRELETFYRERSLEFKPPKFYGQPLNCLKLWRSVIKLGGYDRVTGHKLWRQVGESFHPPKTCTTVSWTFRIFYEKALLEYERHKTQCGELELAVEALPEPLNAENEQANGYQATGSGRARRDAAARAMQGWHAQRQYSHGEVGEPIIKDKNLNNLQKREKNLKSIGSLKHKRPSEVELSVKAARIETSKQLVATVVDVGPPADWVKINVRETKESFEVYALVPGLLREEVRVQSDPAGRLVITGQPEQPDNPWGITAFKKVVSLPGRIDPLQTSAVVSLHGRLFVRVPFEQSNI